MRRVLDLYILLLRTSVLSFQGSRKILCKVSQYNSYILKTDRNGVDGLMIVTFFPFVFHSFGNKVLAYFVVDVCLVGLT